MKLLPTALILFSVILLGCSEKKLSGTSNVEVDIRGQWDSDLQYSNDYFEVMLEIPDDWELEKKENPEMYEKGADFIAGGDDNLKASMKSAVEKTHTVFTAFRYPVGTPRKSNPNITILIENVKALPGIQSGSDYLLAMEDTLKMSKAKMTFQNDPIEEDLGGRHFWSRKMIMMVGQIEVHQNYYATFKDGYVLLMVVTVRTDEDKEVVSKLLDTIQKQ